ncbi:MAG: PEGA domain-containing protein, partial [Planctomycetota bacterium]
MRRAVLLVLVPVLLGGCVRRTIRITSDPSGALVRLNDREIGRTPVEVDFVHYGTYDVRLRLEGHEPLATAGEARSPWWDTLGLDLVAEAVPGEPHAVVEWHFELVPLDDDPETLVDRAGELRARTIEPAPDAD